MNKNEEYSNIDSVSIVEKKKHRDELINKLKIENKKDQLSQTNILSPRLNNKTISISNLPRTAKQFRNSANDIIVEHPSEHNRYTSNYFEINY